MDTPAEVEEEKPFEPVPVQERPQGIVEAIRAPPPNWSKKSSA